METSQPGERKIIALVTLFHPDRDAADNIRLIAGQVSEAILIDNTPGTDSQSLFAGIPRARYFFTGRNLGLSAAFNRFLALDECRESDFLIFFDQDSRVVPGQVETLARDFEALERSRRVGYLGPVFFEENSGRLCGTWDDSGPAGNNCFMVHATITSSLMMRYPALAEAGFWNGHIFLDYADLELGWRLGRAGYENFVSGNVVMRHRQGEGVRRIFSPLSMSWLKVHYFKPVRYYYQARETVKLLREPLVPRKRKRFLVREALTRLLAVLLFPGKGSLSAAANWIKGIRDGLLRVDGPDLQGRT